MEIMNIAFQVFGVMAVFAIIAFVMLYLARNIAISINKTLTELLRKIK